MFALGYETKLILKLTFQNFKLQVCLELGNTIKTMYTLKFNSRNMLSNHHYSSRAINEPPEKTVLRHRQDA